MKQNKNKKKWTAAAAALAIIAALAGTFAWFTSEDSTKNHFETERAGNDTEIVETFNPPKDWVPGQEVNKDVSIQNAGAYNSLIRVSFNEILEKYVGADALVGTADEVNAYIASGGASTPNTIEFYPYTNGTPTGWTKSKLPETKRTVDGKEYTLSVYESPNQAAPGTGSKYKYIAYWENAAGDKFYAKTGPLKRADTGDITLEEEPQFKYFNNKRETYTVDWTNPVYKPTFSVNPDGTAKIKAASDSNGYIELNFVNLSATPTAGKWTYNPKDGYFYFIGVVPSQAQTAQLLDSVTLNANAGNSYGGLEYDLVVNAEGIQAYEAAVVSDQWLTTGDESDAIIAALKALNLDDPNA